VAAAAEVLGAEGTPMNDHRASTRYRAAMLRSSLLKLHADTAAIGAEPARISATALRDTVTASIRAGQGAAITALTAAISITGQDITRHPLRFVTAWRPGRHYPRFTIKKVRARKSNDIVPAATRPEPNRRRSTTT